MDDLHPSEVELAGYTVRIEFLAPAAAQGAVILAHGLHNDLDHESLIAAANGAYQAGWAALRFNFPYRQAGRSEADPFSILTAVHGAAAKWALDRTGGRLVLGGKSLGCRTAAMVGDNLPPSGYVFLGWPLHPGGDTSKVNSGPLMGLKKPLLLIQGEADPLAPQAVLKPVIDQMPSPVQMELIPQGDHSFNTPPEAAHGQERVFNLIGQAVTGFLKSLPA